ncbi:Leucine-rich repeat-containing protein 56, partial [Borealophlyctis nickersoniae]
MVSSFLPSRLNGYPNTDAINPEVITPQDEVEELLEGYLSEAKLKALTKTEDLAKVRHLELRIDTRKTSLGNLDLDGVSSMQNLRELYLAYNDVADLSSLGMLEHLEILDLEGNSVDDIEQIEHLVLCTALQQLTLDGNPLQLSDPGKDEPDNQSISVNNDSVQARIRHAICKMLPGLRILDDQEVTEFDVTGKMPARAVGFGEEGARGR